MPGLGETEKREKQKQIRVFWLIRRISEYVSFFFVKFMHCKFICVFFSRSKSSRLAFYGQSISNVWHSSGLSVLHSEMGTSIHEKSQAVQLK